MTEVGVEMERKSSLRSDQVRSAAPPRVAHVVTSAPTTRLMVGQLRALREAGFEVTLISAPGPDLDQTAEQEGVASRAVPMEREMALWKDSVSLWRLWRLLRELRPSLVNVGTTKAGLLGGIAAWLAGVPCRVYTLHGLRLETTRGAKRRLLTWCEKLSCRLAHRVLCVSESVRTRAVELGLTPRDKAVVLGAGSFNGIDAARFAPTPERARSAAALREKLGIPPGAPVIGFVGRVTRDKGVTELVKAYLLVRARLPEARLLVLGHFETGDPIPKETRHFLERDAGVICLGHVPDPSRYYQVMEVLALPTYREGFPTVALEASAAAKPVVTTCATGACDAVVEGVTGLKVPVGEVKALAEALLRVLQDPELAQRLGRQGRARILRDFRQAQLWEELASLYSQLLERRGARRHARGRLRLAVKRGLDILGALLGLLLLAPVMGLTALAIRLEDGSPVLFRQSRTGRGGEVFTLCKFRTMRDVRDEEGRLLADGERLTSVGRVLRRFSLDELPQLWNVLKGEMSLVGPRPLLPEYLPVYTERERLRHLVKPGLTGLAQINGRHLLPFSRRLELDSWYAEHWNLGMDLSILLRTLPKALWSRERLACQDEAVDDRGFWQHLQEIRPGRGEIL